MLQKKVLDDMDGDDITRQLTFNRSVALVENVFPPVTDFMVPIHEDMKLYRNSIAHAIRLEEVFRICNKSSRTLVGDLAFVELLISAGFYLYEVRLGTPGLALLATAEDICAVRATGASDHPSPAESSRNSLPPQSSTPAATPTIDDDFPGAELAKWIKLRATALQISWAIVATSTGISQRQKITEHMAKVLELRKAYAAADHSHDRYVGRLLLANAHNDMAEQLIDNGEYDAAEGHLNISIRMKKELQSERIMPPYQFAEQNKNMALIKAGQRRTEEAVDLSQEAVDVLPKEEEDGVYSTFLFIHGICLANAGSLSAAFVAFTESYKLRVAGFGIHGIPTLHNLYAIAYTHYRLGLYPEARYVSPNNPTRPQGCGVNCEGPLHT